MRRRALELRASADVRHVEHEELRVNAHLHARLDEGTAQPGEAAAARAQRHAVVRCVSSASWAEVLKPRGAMGARADEKK
jgi:hypothetical protein